MNKNHGLVYFLFHLVGILLYQWNTDFLIVMYPVWGLVMWAYLRKPISILEDNFMENAQNFDIHKMMQAHSQLT